MLQDIELASTDRAIMAGDVTNQPDETQEMLTHAGAKLVESSDFAKSGIHTSAEVTNDSLHAVAQTLRSADYMFEASFGIDRNPGTEVVYLLRSLSKPSRIRLKLKLTDGENEVKSLTEVYAGADWYEREMRDMFGLNFVGHPNLQPLLLPAGTNFHPLRKNFTGADVVVPESNENLPEYEIQQAMSVGRVSNERRDFFLNMGPQHPSTHGVLRILLHAEGEMALGGRCYLGYSHRGTEKIAESKQYVQFLPYTDRIDYLSPLNYNWGFAALLERATGIEATARSKTIRVIMGELARISSHLVWLGTFMLDLGATTPFLFCFEDRELILKLFEKTTGQRMTNSYIVVGGVRNEIPSDFSKDVSAIVSQLRKRLPEFNTLIFQNEIFVRRTVGIGNISRKQVRDFGITGPAMLGSGVNFDIRRDEPGITEYENYDFNIPTEKEGDCMARSKVRFKEMEVSLNLIEQAMQRLEEGPTRAKIPRNLKINEGEYYSAGSSPRGLLGWYLVADGSMKPSRLKIRVPSLANLQVVENLLPGHRVADVVAILGSLDVVIPEIDR